jgi:hypothetical protein
MGRKHDIIKREKPTTNNIYDIMCILLRLKQQIRDDNKMRLEKNPAVRQFLVFKSSQSQTQDSQVNPFRKIIEKL